MWENSGYLGWLELFFLIYFTFVNVVYAVLIFIGAITIYFRRKELAADDLSYILKANSLPSITFLVPIYNESACITGVVNNLISLTYPNKRVVIINDGSTDETLNILINRLDLTPIHFDSLYSLSSPRKGEPLKVYPSQSNPTHIQEKPNGYLAQTSKENGHPSQIHLPFFDLPSTQIKRVYQSKMHPEIMVIDKVNGTKYDALNAGLNACRDDYYIQIDADTYLDNQDFEALIRPILDSPKVVAVGASVRVRNDTITNYRTVSTEGTPKTYLGGMQTCEYLRSFTMRQGWNYAGGNYCISGAFSVLSTELIKKIGGYAPTFANDLEIVMRVTRFMKATKAPYAVNYLPDPVAWSEAPKTFKHLGYQRMIWQRGLLESLWFNKSMFFNPKYGSYGLFVYPFALFGEALEPLVELAAYIYIIVGLYVGYFNWELLAIIVLIGWALTMLTTLFCLFVEELSYRRYPSFKSVLKLAFYALIETFGYRQLTIWWRLRGFFSFFGRFGEIRKDSKEVNRRFREAVDEENAKKTADSNRKMDDRTKKMDDRNKKVADSIKNAHEGVKI